MDRIVFTVRPRSGKRHEINTVPYAATPLQLQEKSNRRADTHRRKIRCQLPRYGRRELTAGLTLALLAIYWGQAKIDPAALSGKIITPGHSEEL